MNGERDRDAEAVAAYKARVLADFKPRDAGEAAAADALAGLSWRLEAALADLLGERPDGRPRVREVRFMNAADLV